MAEEEPKQLGRYEIVRVLGKGAMGVVYEGKDPNIGRRVAIKTARRDVLEASGRADEMMARFLREAQSAGGLNHPNIITIYDAAEEGAMAYIAMEFLEGGDLEEYLAKNQYIEQDDAIEICATIGQALAFAHKDGIVHRDIKPANIIMTPKGIKIADFGIAHMSDSNLTREGAMIGTPHYMSPEQFQGRKVDGRSDLFSLAVMLYEMLTGEKPFTGEQLSTVMTAVIKLEPMEPSELNSMVDDTLNRVVMKALSKNPGKRYADGDAFAAALREAIKPSPDPAITQVGVDPGATATMPAADATVMGAGAVTTVGVASAPDTSATIDAEATPQGGDATIAMPPDAATPKETPPAKEETAAEKPAATVGLEAEKKPAAGEPGKKSPIPKIKGGIAAAAIVVVAVVVMVRGGSSAPENYWAAQGTVEVRLIDSVDQYGEWDANNFRRFPNGAQDPSQAIVKIGKSHTDQGITVDVLTGAIQSFDIPPEYSHLEIWRFVGRQGEEYDANSTWSQSAKKPGDVLAIKICLIKKGVLTEWTENL
ncbi:MAG: protein kinase [Candidatus Hydrogenedentes bacterium]|nr:protein kinase [Candidatus Hydrogenedentota bacterium]